MANDGLLEFEVVEVAVAVALGLVLRELPLVVEVARFEEEVVMVLVVELVLWVAREFDVWTALLADETVAAGGSSDARYCCISCTSNSLTSLAASHADS